MEFFLKQSYKSRNKKEKPHKPSRKIPPDTCFITSYAEKKSSLFNKYLDP